MDNTNPQSSNEPHSINLDDLQVAGEEKPVTATPSGETVEPVSPPTPPVTTLNIPSLENSQGITEQKLENSQTLEPNIPAKSKKTWVLAVIFLLMLGVGAGAGAYFFIFNDNSGTEELHASEDQENTENMENLEEVVKDVEEKLLPEDESVSDTAIIEDVFPEEDEVFTEDYSTNDDNGFEDSEETAIDTTESEEENTEQPIKRIKR